MKTKGLLFNPEMVRAFLRGQKNQTRRIIKNPPGKMIYDLSKARIGEMRDEKNAFIYAPYCHKDDAPDKWAGCEGVITAPLQPGDIIYVRENFIFEHKWDGVKPSEVPLGEPVYFPADKTIRGFNGYQRGFDVGTMRPSMFMPKWVARIKRTVTAVRVERVQDISEADARGEGVTERLTMFGEDEWTALPGGCYRFGFAKLWEDIYGAGAWARNDFVWVYDLDEIDAEEIKK